jgi:hypothetical protein
MNPAGIRSDPGETSSKVLLEVIASELFGHEKGAFTGALNSYRAVGVNNVTRA